MTLVVALILLMMGSAFFSATETAFSSLNKPRLKNMAAEGNKKAKLAYKLEENYDELISSTLVGNNVVNIAATTIANFSGHSFAKLFGVISPKTKVITVIKIVIQ